MKRITKYDRMLDSLHIKRKEFFKTYKINKASYYVRLDKWEVTEPNAIKLIDAILKHQDLMEVSVEQITAKN